MICVKWGNVLVLSGQISLGSSVHSEQRPGFQTGSGKKLPRLEVY